MRECVKKSVKAGLKFILKSVSTKLSIPCCVETRDNIFHPWFGCYQNYAIKAHMTPLFRASWQNANFYATVPWEFTALYGFCHFISKSM